MWAGVAVSITKIDTHPLKYAHYYENDKQVPCVLGLYAAISLIGTLITELEFDEQYAALSEIIAQQQYVRNDFRATFNR